MAYIGGCAFDRKAPFAATLFKKGGWAYFQGWAYFRYIYIICFTGIGKIILVAAL